MPVDGGLRELDTTRHLVADMTPTFDAYPAAAVVLDLTDVPVREDDPVVALQRLADAAARLPGGVAAGCGFAGCDGGIAQTAAGDEIGRRLEEAQSRLREGPCLDSRRTGKPLANVPMAHPHSRARWPRFAPRAVDAGITAVTALPLRYGGRVLGSLDLYHRHSPRPRVDVRAGRILADAAAIGLAHRELIDEHREREGQLQTALDSRVIIEQAKGLMAERLHCTVDDAFDLLRHDARRRQMKLTDLAHSVVHDPNGEPIPLPRH
ncbi:GAF and ANTAR domain-containing protein [Streptomyces sp. TRM66268-LWL]|uniref:GAF and ANTAR domain-containing protein n=1 Tax=Streptomyces polyasparticus TaxID=2767826 RepID=A0ABR7SJY3_9ACTN|nr:GAF and ANTAR domain-containing protein [Streptomyces polyasparticus]MBC9714791.1 GAF and ANTAR domain-containing protein [Streptomyces polyasparticus]